MGKDKIQLLSQALNAATSSLNLAKQLLSEVERGGGAGESPGLVGKYDGMFMITEAGKKYPVPDNYAAKTKLVYGDKLKMIEGPEGRRFKLLEEVERTETEAQLAIKDGHFEALGKEGSYKIIQGAVRYWNGAEKDKIKILLPKGGKNIPFACLVEVVGKHPGGGEPQETKPSLPQPRPQPPKSEPHVERPVLPRAGEGSRTSREITTPKKEEPKPVKRVSVREEKKEEKPRLVKKETVKEEKTPAKKSAKPLDEEELR